jgi:3-hydroxybutyryl-CoA dehydrogenase
MGASAAVCFQRAGYRVILWARNQKKLPAVRKTLARLDAWLNRNAFGVPPSGGIRAKPAIELTSDLSLIDQLADVMMDCIAEDLAEKVKLFRRLARARQRKALFITTTSGLSITEMGRRSGLGKQLVGAHFWNPPHLMPLVEVIRGRDTSEKALDAVVRLVRSIGKIPVRVEKDVPGFIGNRLLHAMWREAIHLVQRGIASPDDIDRVARLTFGLRLPAVGPLENMDIVGLPLIEAIHDYLLADLADDHRPLPLLKRLRRSGRTFHNRSPRAMQKLTARRDRQIVHQLAFLRQWRAL